MKQAKAAANFIERYSWDDLAAQAAQRLERLEGEITVREFAAKSKGMCYMSAAKFLADLVDKQQATERWATVNGKRTRLYKLK